MDRNAVFLSGWEYNRVLQDDPVAPRQSALPAEGLWNGAGQFWLFEYVYCTKESFEGEVAAAETLDWSTGNIYQNLKKRGFLKVFDWKRLEEESPLQHRRLVEVHRTLRSEYDESEIMHLLKSGKGAELEEIKLRLLHPIVEHLGCISNVSPNSLRQWIAPNKQSTVTPSSLSQALQHLARPLAAKMEPIRAGAKVCNPPGTGVSEEDRLAQKEIEEKVQRPMIPDLLAGLLPQPDYHKALLPTAEVYRPINAQILQDYCENIEKLERLRDLAKEHLWKDLHGEWIPALEQDPSFLPEFCRLLKLALQRADFYPFFDYLTYAILTVAPLVTAYYAADLAKRLGLHEGTTAAGLAGATEFMVERIKRPMSKTDQLTLFYQKAKRTPWTKKQPRRKEST